MDANATVLVTGGSGFLGSRIINELSEKGFKNLRCLARTKNSVKKLERIESQLPGTSLEIVEGNLTSQDICDTLVDGVNLIFHCAAEKGGPPASAFLNTVVTTRNLLESASRSPDLKRFVHVSSFSVYGTAALKTNSVVDENTGLETNLKKRDDSYTYVKLKQELLLQRYQEECNLPVVIVRPGVVYGPGGDEISRRVGMKLFGLFLNIGKSNLLPLSYVDNCAEAIVQAGTVPGIEGEIVNIHDNDLRTCNEFLKMYRQQVRKIKTIKVPYTLFWLFSWMVEAYARYSNEQIPAVLNRYRTASTWKKRKFDNTKLVEVLGWKQTIPTNTGLERHFQFFRTMYSDTKSSS